MSPPKLSPAPALSVPAPAHLGIVPLWDDANLPLRPAPKHDGNTIRWIGSATVSLAVGALVAASLLTVRISDYAQILPYGNAERGLHPQPAQPQQLAAVAVPPQVFEAEEPLEIALEEVESAQAATEPEPVVIAELRVTTPKIGKAAKPKKTKIGPIRKAPKHGAKRSRTMVAQSSASQPAPQAEVVTEGANVAPAAAEAQPEPAAEAAAPEAAAPEAAAPEAAAPEAAAPEAAAPEAAAPEAAAPEAAALEVAAPEVAAPEVAALETAALETAAPEAAAPVLALPEKLTRDQVRGGLDKVRAKVLACAKGTYGKVVADVTIRAPGQVSNAVIEGTFVGTKAGACMEKTIRSAKFPAFSGADIAVRYPYSF